MFGYFTTKGTQLMTIYQPYFYIIQDTRNGMYYAGSKWAQGCHPDHLLKESGYTTSSETINKIIHENGLDTFVIRKIKTFETGDKAYDYETRFLVKVDAKRNSRFYNAHNNDRPAPYGSEEFKKMILEKYGAEYASQSKIVKEKIKSSNMKNLGVEYPGQSEIVRNKQKETCLIRYGVENVSQSDIIKERQKETFLENYGVENPFQSEQVKSTMKNTWMEKYGVDNPLKSEVVRRKFKNTMLEKYGVENASQSIEVKMKKKIKIDQKLSRVELIKIKKYQKKYNLKFGKNWSRRKDDYILKLLSSLIKKYGEL
jgi:hypothetical protein